MYKFTHPNDNGIRPSEFIESVKAAFPELYPNGSDDAVGGLKSKRAKVANVRDSSIDDDVLMSNTDVPTAGTATNLRGVSPESARDIAVDLTGDDDGERLRHSKFVSPTSTAGPGLRRTTPSAPWGYANPVATDKDVEMLSPPAHVLNSNKYRDILRPSETPEQTKDRVEKVEFLKSMERQFGKEKADEAAKLAERKRRQKTLGESEQAEERPPQSAFGESEQVEERRGQSRWDEFEQAMRNVQPGGAFAGGGGNRGGTSRGKGDRGRGGSSGTGRGGSGRLDVLDWDV